MVNRSTKAGATNVLEMLQKFAPVTYTGLHRPITGQGGFQSLLRNMQAELGITPNPAALSATPASRQTFHTAQVDDKLTTSTGRTLPPEPVTKAATVTAGNVEATTLQAVRMLRAIGRNDEAERLLRSLVETDVPSQQHQPSEEESVSVADLNAVVARAKARRTEKAELRAQGRQRRSPKLTDASRAARTYRMLQLHHGPNVAGRRMREKFGADWKKLLKG